MTQIPDAWYYDLPKVELHVHLEGSIPLDTLWELIQQYGGDPSVPTRDALTERFQYTDFAHFIQTWVWKNRFIRTLADFTRIAEAVAHDYASQNIRYVEAHYSPTDFRTLGFTISEITQAIRTGLDRCPDTTVMLICDVVRDSPVERAMATVHAVAQLRHLGVVGIGLGGSEQSHPPEPFAPVFALARTYRLHTTVHAGEAAGPASIWGAIHALQPEASVMRDVQSKIRHSLRTIRLTVSHWNAVHFQTSVPMCSRIWCRTPSADLSPLAWS
ncbi:MAG: hypothetical protein RLY87_1726 [Chloroflexota bacterium]